MKKIKVILIILASLVLLFFLLIKIFAVKETKDISTQTTGDWLNEKIEPTYLPEKPDLPTYASTPKTTINQPLPASSTQENPANTSFVDLTNLRKKYPNGVKLVSIDEQNLSSDDRQEMLKQINNLKIHGSLSGGKITHEFSDLDTKRNHLHEYKQTSFTPTEFLDILNHDMKLTGKIYSGAYSDETGFDSIYRLYENDFGNKLEVTEMYLNPKHNTIMEITKETLNHTISDIPMTFETIKTDNSNIVYNASFTVNEKYLSFSSMGYTQQDFEEMLLKYIQKNQ